MDKLFSMLLGHSMNWTVERGDYYNKDRKTNYQNKKIKLNCKLGRLQNINNENDLNYQKNNNKNLVKKINIKNLN